MPTGALAILALTKMKDLHILLHEIFFLAPTVAQEMLIFVPYHCLLRTISPPTFTIYHSIQRVLREYLKSTQRAIREKESNQTSSYRRSLKYFVLLDQGCVFNLYFSNFQFSVKSEMVSDAWRSDEGAGAVMCGPDLETMCYKSPVLTAQCCLLVQQSLQCCGVNRVKRTMRTGTVTLLILFPALGTTWRFKC